MTLRERYQRWLVPIGLVLLLGVAVVARPAPVAASTLHVTSCADDGGVATLRGRIAAAAGDTIVFDQDCTITLTTASGALTLTKNVAIDGTGHTVIVDGNNAVRVLAVNSGVTANLTALTIQHGSIQSINIGGGIYNRGTLTVANSTISGNRADNIGAGIANTGTMTVTNSMIASNTVSDQHELTSYLIGGGGIYNLGTLNVTGSTVSGNTAGYDNAGGGILNDSGTVTVTNSTFSGNSAIQYGGGGIDSDGGTVTVTNSTFTGNTAYHGGGIEAGNVYSQGGVTLTVTNTIVAGNQPPAHVEVHGAVTSGGHNLIGDADGSTGWGASDLTGTDASPLNPLLGPLGNYGGPTQTRPLLPGSPAVDAGDDAVCAQTGAGKVNNVDQRGVARPVGPHCDIGAFESHGFTITKTGGDNQSQHTSNPFFTPLTFTVSGAGAPYNEPVQGGILIVTPPANGASAVLSGVPASLPANGQVTLTATANGTAGGPYTVTVSIGGPSSIAFSLTNIALVPHSTYTVGTSADHAVGSVSEAACYTAGNTTCALRDALIYATSGTDTIVFNATGQGTMTLTSGALTLATSVAITGPGANVLALDGGCTGCDPGGTPSGGVTVLVVNNGVTASISGLTIQHGNANVGRGYDSLVYGGGICNNGGALTLTNVTIRRNVNQTKYTGGGGLSSNGGSVTVQTSTITENRTPTGDGAGIFIDSGSTIILTNSTLSGNSANFGGGINNDHGTLTVTNSMLSGNSATYGGGIYNDFGTLTVTNSTLSGNNAKTGGGGILNLGMATVTNSTVTGNTATTTGGGIYNYSGTLTVTNTIVAANAATSGADLSGLVATGGHNLFGTTSGATITLGSGDLVNPNPRLGPLGNNGGPTQTVPLLKGSSTIDAGDDAVCAQTGAGKVNNVDQRGVTRPFGAHCDIGAFEYQEPNALPAPRPGGTPGGVPNALPGSRPGGTTGGPTPNPLPAPRP